MASGVWGADGIGVVGATDFFCIDTIPPTRRSVWWRSTTSAARAWRIGHDRLAHASVVRRSATGQNPIRSLTAHAACRTDGVHPFLAQLVESQGLFEAQTVKSHGHDTVQENDRNAALGAPKTAHFRNGRLVI